jgi:alpha-tubulin suppressor-like RCC1 family protein
MRHVRAFGGIFFVGCLGVSLLHCVGDEPSVTANPDAGPGTDATTPPGPDGSTPPVDGTAADSPSPPADTGPGTDAAEAGLPPLIIAPTVAAGFGLTCSGRPSGRVYCWGKNDTGQLGNLLTSTTPTPTPTQVAQITTAARVVTTTGSACALLTDHTVWCWGNNSSGQLGHPIAADTPNTYSPTPTKVAGLADVMEIGAGGSFVCARKADSSVWCWGDNTSNQLGHSNTTDGACVNSTLCSATPTQVAGLTADAIAVGFGHACARVGTTAFCWGDNSNAQLGHLAGQDGDVNNSNPTPKQAAATNVAALFAGGGYVTCALDPTSTTSCWGSDAHGQLGDNGGVATSAAPIAIAGLPKTATKAIPAFTNSCAIMGQLAGVWCWGDNSEGGDGVADAGASHSAATVPSLASMTFVDIAAGQATDNWCAATAGGDVYCWGINLYDELGHSNAGDATCNGSKCDTTATKVVGLP